MAILATLIFVAFLFWLAFLSERKEARQAGTWLGMSGVKAAYIWNHADAPQRRLMLAGIGIMESDYLLNRPWSGLPPFVAMSLADTLQEIRDEQR